MYQQPPSGPGQYPPNRQPSGQPPSGHYPPMGQQSGHYPLPHTPTYTPIPPGASFPGLSGQPFSPVPGTYQGIASEVGPGDRIYPHQPPKKPRRWPWVLAILVALVIGYGMGQAGRSTPTPTPAPSATTANGGQASTSVPTQAATPTPKPTEVPKKWTVTHSWEGVGNKQTEIFTAPDNWRISWSCDSPIEGAPLYINVEKPDGFPLTVGPSPQCQPGGSLGSSDVHKGGQAYLNIITGISWKIEVQELK